MCVRTLDVDFGDVDHVCDGTERILLKVKFMEHLDYVDIHFIYNQALSLDRSIYRVRI